MRLSFRVKIGYLDHAAIRGVLALPQPPARRAAGLDRGAHRAFIRRMRTPESNSGKTGPAPAAAAPKKALSPAAERALAEAAARRAERERAQADRPKETPDRGGRDPVRYGDWEHKGIASDF
jgi:hypothetical protein